MADPGVTVQPVHGLAPPPGTVEWSDTCELELASVSSYSESE